MSSIDQVLTMVARGVFDCSARLSTSNVSTAVGGELGGGDQARRAGADDQHGYLFNCHRPLLHLNFGSEL